MLTPQEIKSRLDQLILESQATAPKLSERLWEMKRWIARKKDGQLMRKRHVMQLLDELVTDSTFWLRVQSLSPTNKEAELARLSPVERYWYECLLPAWFNEKDPKLYIWKQKLMADEFDRSDEALIEEVCQQIEARDGETLNPYIADLSMCTDLIVCGTATLVLCVQLTTLRLDYSINKQMEWESTLVHWGIERGLFLSYNSALSRVHSILAHEILLKSDYLPSECYNVLSIG